MKDLRSITALTVLLAGLATSGAAMAQKAGPIEARVQAAVAKVQDACSADLKQYCGTVTPGEGRVLLCLQAHEDKISRGCDYALFDASRKLDRALAKVEMAADACWSDVQKNCADVPPGGGNIMQCLAAKKTAVSKRCQSVLGKMQAAR